MKLFGIFYCIDALAALTLKNSIFFCSVSFNCSSSQHMSLNFCRIFSISVCILTDYFASSVLYSITQLLLSCNHWLGSTWDTGTFPTFPMPYIFTAFSRACISKRDAVLRLGGSRLTAPRAALLHHLSRTPTFPYRISEKKDVFGPVPPKEGVLNPCVGTLDSAHAKQGCSVHSGAPCAQKSHTFPAVAELGSLSLTFPSPKQADPLHSSSPTCSKLWASCPSPHNSSLLLTPWKTRCKDNNPIQ